MVTLFKIFSAVPAPNKRRPAVAFNAIGHECCKSFGTVAFASSSILTRLCAA